MTNRRRFLSRLIATAGALAGFKNLGQAKETSKKNEDELRLTPKKMAVLIKVPNELLTFNYSVVSLLYPKDHEPELD